jgi:hypothetical protein
MIFTALGSKPMSDYNLFGVSLKLRNEFFRYMDHGHAPGAFLYAVLCNNLLLAIENATMEQKTHLSDIVMWVKDNAHESVWGSESRVIRHLEQYSGPKAIQ